MFEGFGCNNLFLFLTKKNVLAGLESLQIRNNLTSVKFISHI